MASRILSSTHALEDTIGRIYMSPRFVQAEGLWKRISDVITVRADSKLPGFVISYKDSSIMLSVVSSQATVFKTSASKYQARWDHFTVSVSNKVPDELQWEVKVVGKVSKKGDRWKFDELEGCDVGLSLADWQDLFGNKMSIDGDIVTMDMTDFKKDMTGDKVLDPSTIDIIFGRIHQKLHLSDWSVARGDGNTESTTSTTIGDIFATSRFDAQNIIRRTDLTFNTSGVESFINAALFVSQVGGVNLSIGHISRHYYTGSPAAANIYGKMFTAYTDRPIGFLAARFGTWFAIDITSELEALTSFRFAFAHQYDVQNLGAAPAEIDELTITPTGDNAPYIEYQPPTRRAGAITCPRRYGGRSIRTYHA